MAFNHTYNLDVLISLAEFHLFGDEGDLFKKTIKKLGYKDLKEYLDIEFFDGAEEYGAREGKKLLAKSASQLFSELTSDRKRKRYKSAGAKFPSLSDEAKENFYKTKQKLWRLNYSEGLFQYDTVGGRAFFRNFLIERFLEFLRIEPDNTFMLDHVKYMMDFPITDRVVSDKKIETQLPKTENSYYWNHSPEKLKELYNLLLIGKMVAENQSFFQSFHKFEDKDRVKTEWLFPQRSLFCLMYLLYDGKSTYEGENISDICVKLFTVKGIKANYKSTKENFSTFIEKTGDKYYLNKKHAPILEIVHKMGF